MNIAIVGLWHLGTVTAACLAKLGITVTAYDPDKNLIQKLQRGEPPIYEPGLNELIASGIANNALHFTDGISDVSTSDVIWITFDTQIDDEDNADSEYVFSEIRKLIPYLQKKSLIVISSQIPVGSTRQLITYCQEHVSDKEISFAYIPENLRLGKAIEVFMNPDRLIVGIQSESDKTRIQHLFHSINTPIIWMSLESAEMTKHAINAFLAASVVFINELATLCDKIDTDVREVEIGLKSESRIGAKAYLRAGNAISGGTLIRDVKYVHNLANHHQIEMPLFSALLQSNQLHKEWSRRKLQQIYRDLQDKRITALGLTYKPGTNTLRRSSTIETCKWLRNQGAQVKAYDPLLHTLPSELVKYIELQSSFEEAIIDADAIIIGTECPEFIKIEADEILNRTKKPYILDAGGFLAKTLGCDSRIHYFSVGK